MKRFLQLVLTASALMITACASTGEPQSGLTDDLYFLGFTPQSDGGFLHGGTGLVCPPTLLSLPYANQKEYGEKQDDASCTYRQGNDVATIYLSRLDYTFEEVFGSSVASISQGSFGKDISLDREATQSCVLGGLLFAAVPSDEKVRRNAIYQFDAATFTHPDYVTLVQMTELDGKFMKLRYTKFGEDDSVTTCLAGASALREIYDLSAEQIIG